MWYAGSMEIRTEREAAGWVYGKAWVETDGTALSFHVPDPPEPGTICPICGERTPNENALRVRKWRARKKEKR